MENSMKVMPVSEVQQETVGGEAVAAKIQWLISDKDGAPNFYMRLFELGENGATPHHEHAWEHEVYILEGKGKLVAEDTVYDLGPNMFAFVKGGEVHHFENTGNTPFKFLCLIPREDAKCC